MKYKQLVPFDLAKMGTKKDWCLANVRDGFGIPPKYPDAKAAMEANKRAGLLHDISTLPNDVSVPVFLDTPSVWEHVIVADHGKFYSDGKLLTSLTGLTAFGWGESLNDVRIVEPVLEEAPQPVEPEEPTVHEDDLKEGDIVVPIELVDEHGTPLHQYDDNYTVVQYIPGSDRVVLGVRGKVWAALSRKNVRKVK